MKKQNKKHESGRSMIEMVGVLAVMGLITAAAFVLITSAMRSQKLSRADDDIAALGAGVRLLYNNSEDFSGLGTIGGDNSKSDETLKALGFASVKPAYCSDKTYSVGVASDSKKFIIQFDTGDESLCAGLAQRTWANGGTGSCNKTVLSITFDSGK